MDPLWFQIYTSAAAALQTDSLNAFVGSRSLFLGLGSLLLDELLSEVLVSMGDTSCSSQYHCCVINLKESGYFNVQTEKNGCLTKGGAMGWWLTLLSHSKEVLGSNPPVAGGFVCVKFACSSPACMGSLQVLWLPPTLQRVEVNW